MRRRRFELVIDLTSRCNIRCVMCYFSAVDQLRFEPFDLDTGANGNIEMATFEHVASELMPHARSVSLGCAAEPLIHPRFVEMLEVIRTYRVPDISLQTNLLALTPAAASAIVENEVRTVAVSIDGTCKETYEKIRVGASWERLMSRLALLRDARNSNRERLPRLRVTFAWMRSNRDELSNLPAFAQSVGAREIDVRFVVPTVAVDNRTELLDTADSESLMGELWMVARDATSRGIRLSAYPAMVKQPDPTASLVSRLRHKAWLFTSGIEGAAMWRRTIFERLNGCSFPGRFLLIRPNGAVLPCPFWEEEPIALVPRDGRRQIVGSEGLRQISRALQAGCPVGSCLTCEVRKDAMFRPRANMASDHAKRKRF